MYVRAKIVVIYSGGADLRACRLALAVAEGAWDAGAEVRVRCLRSLAPLEGARFTPQWAEVLGETEGVPEVTIEDLTWADVAIAPDVGDPDGSLAREGVKVPSAAELEGARKQGRRAAQGALALRVGRVSLSDVA